MRVCQNMMVSVQKIRNKFWQICHNCNTKCIERHILTMFISNYGLLYPPYPKGLGLCIAYKALGRNGLQFGMLMYPDGLHSAFMDAYGYCCWSVCPSICLFVRLRHFQVAVHLQRRGVVIIGRWLLPSLVDTGDICCHYWQHILVIIGMTEIILNFNRISKIKKLCTCFQAIFKCILLCYAGFYTKGCPLVKSNLICPSDKLIRQPGCPVLNINIQGNFCISQGNGFSDNLPENLV